MVVMPTVFVSQRPSNVRDERGARPRWDVERPALDLIKFGRFVYLTEFTDVNYLTTNELLAKMRKTMLLENVRDCDYVLMTGHILPQVLAGLIFAEYNGIVNMLHWDSRASMYCVSRFELYTMTEE